MVYGDSIDYYRCVFLTFHLHFKNWLRFFFLVNFLILCFQQASRAIKILLFLFIFLKSLKTLKTA